MAFEFKFPDVGEGIHEGKIVKWRVKEGDEIADNQAIADVETDKAVVEIPSPVSGKITKINFQEGEVIQVGEVLAIIEEGKVAGKNSKKTDSSAQKTEQTEKKRESTGVVGSLEEAAPGVMKAPDLSSSGAVFSEPKTESTESKTPSKGIGVVKEGLKQNKKFDFFGYIERAPYDGERKAVGEHMVKSMFTTDLWALREKAKVKAEIDGIKLTFLPYFISAAAAALQKHPYVNAELNEEERVIILKKYYNIGIAVDTEEGLMVPVIKGAEKKSINDLAKEIDDLAQKARTRKINPMDMKGGTFTITNIGSAGGGWFATPVIHYPQAAVLATGMIMDMAVPVNGKVEIRKMLPLSLAFDHRIFDGAEAARFVNALKELLGNPKSL